LTHGSKTPKDVPGGNPQRRRWWASLDAARKPRCSRRSGQMPGWKGRPSGGRDERGVSLEPSGKHDTRQDRALHHHCQGRRAVLERAALPQGSRRHGRHVLVLEGQGRSGAELTSKIGNRHPDSILKERRGLQLVPRVRTCNACNIATRREQLRSSCRAKLARFPI
jgi:hypothetical protein